MMRKRGLCETLAGLGLVTLGGFQFALAHNPDHPQDEPEIVAVIASSNAAIIDAITGDVIEAPTWPVIEFSLIKSS
jgi:hypothetical protein